MPGKLGNTNALKSGRRSARPGTVLAVLGRRYSQAYRDVCRLRREVESKLGGRDGLSLFQAARLQSLCRIELGCRVSELTIRDGKLPPEQLRAERSLIAQWTCQRDRLLGELLGSGKAAGSPWDVLTEQIDLPAVAPAGNAVAGQRGVVAGIPGIPAVTVAPTESQLCDAVEGPR